MRMKGLFYMYLIITINKTSLSAVDKRGLTSHPPLPKFRNKPKLAKHAFEHHLPYNPLK